MALVCGDAAQATNYLLQVKLRNGSALTRDLFGHCRSKVSRAAALHPTSKMLAMSFRGSNCLPRVTRAIRNRAPIATSHLWVVVCDVWDEESSPTIASAGGKKGMLGGAAQVCALWQSTAFPCTLDSAAKSTTNWPPECGDAFGE